MKLKFKSLSLLLAVVLFFGITLTPITASAAMESKTIKVYVTAPNFGQKYSRWNAKKTSSEELGKASWWNTGYGKMKTFNTENKVYYNPGSTTTNYIRRTEPGGLKDDYKITFTAAQIKNNNYMRIKCNSAGQPCSYQFYKTYRDMKADW